MGSLFSDECLTISISWGVVGVSGKDSLWHESLELEAAPSLAILVDAISKGLFRELNPGPLAPEARIIPLDQTAR
jgi:hypothetical protein